MIILAKFHQENLVYDQHTSIFTLNDVVPSTISLTALNITHVRFPRDSTPYRIAFIVIVDVLSCFAALLVVAALAYYLWKARQGRVHTERIRLAPLVPRRRRAHQPPTSVTDIRRIERRISTDAYNPETALPWSLFQNFRPTPALTAPAPATLPLPAASRSSVDAPTEPERARVTDPYLLQELYRPIVPSPNLNARSNSSSPVLHTPPPPWQSLSPRPPAYDFDDATPSSSLGL